ncbi:hypothetical protein [Leucobacter aridicollis]|uniref:hypothetical protein n=1 Tax=Leucobacter aridicollis TaxID=283878 RepID=UPI0021699A6B|nr:hypothetical protein [Leucobacter aridicollis]MCS3428595.1 hypothetical protein [Leucobacter aridicollis]
MNATVPVEADPIELFGAPAPLRDTSRDRADRLRPAPAPAPKPKKSPVLGAIVAVCVILGIFAAQLALSILVSQGAYESRALEIEERDLGRVERVLSQNLDKLASPQNLVENAAALGMVQNVAPATMRLSDGAIQGDLNSVTREASPNLVPNAQLENLPVVDAKGLLTNRNAQAAPIVDAAAAVAWQGKLPAPETH